MRRVALIERWIAEGGPHVVTTPNPEIVMRARRDPDFQADARRAALNVPDGIGLLLAARLRGERFREHVRGTDLVHRLAALGAARGHRWYLLGAADGVARKAADRLQARYPGLIVAGAEPGSPRPEDDAATWAMIRAAGPLDLILVAYGAPAQERWLERSLGPLAIPVGIGVGGVLNFLSGEVPRAPSLDAAAGAGVAAPADRAAVALEAPTGAAEVRRPGRRWRPPGERRAERCRSKDINLASRFALKHLSS